MSILVEYAPSTSSITHICPQRKVSTKVFSVVWGKVSEFLIRKVTAMAKARRYTMEQIEAARKKLRSLPMKTIGKTRAEVAELLGKDIRKAVRQGYSLHDIRDLLADAGVSVPLARLEAVFRKDPKPQSVTDRERTEKTARPGGVDDTGEHGSTGGI